MLAAFTQEEIDVLGKVHGIATRWALPQHSLHGFEHAAGLERFDDEVLGTSLNCVDNESLLAHRAAHDDARRWIERGNLAHRVDASHIRHHDVHRDEVGTQLLVLGDGLGPGVSLTDDGETGLLQNVRQHRAHEHSVIAYQNRMTHSSSEIATTCIATSRTSSSV